MSKWTEENVETLKSLWQTGKTAREIAEILGNGFSRNSVIGKSFRLNLSAKIKTRNSSNFNKPTSSENINTTKI